MKAHPHTYAAKAAASEQKEQAMQYRLNINGPDFCTIDIRHSVEKA